MLIMNNIYDCKNIGPIIKKERKELGMNQEALAVALNISARQTIAKWENGTAIPQLEDMLNMCNLFNCELGYLLGDQKLKTKVATDIHEQTGLSSEAIEYLQYAHSEASRIPEDNYDSTPAVYDIIVRTINFLLESECNTLNTKYDCLLESISRYLYGNFNYYYDDFTFDNENLFNHVEQLGFWDKKLGNGLLLSDDMVSKAIMLDIQEKLLYAREHIQNNIPQRITPSSQPIDNADDDYEHFETLINNE